MRFRLVAVPLILLAGCDHITTHLPTADPEVEPAPLGTRFDPATAGTLTGTVHWTGDRPKVSPVRGPQWTERTNPNAPRITPAGTLADAVVYLQGVDPAAAAPWPHPPVAVEADDDGITVRPGGRVGFVPVGGEVAFRATDDSLAGVRARGAAFFTLMLPDRTSARRRLDRPGRVELTSPANVYWAVADLFVCRHPYYTRTDDQGRFRFDRVPPGRYEVVCWVPNWEVVATERDPETGAVFRAKYGRPAEVITPVHLDPQGTTVTRIDVSVSAFTPPHG